MSSATGHLHPSPSPVIPANTPRSKPIAGVSTEALTLAVRRVEAGWQQGTASPTDVALAARLLAAIALAVDLGVPDYVTELIPKPPARLCRRLIDLLRVELLSVPPHAPESPAGLLRLLGRLEEVRKVVDADSVQQFGSNFSGPDGLDLMVEVLHDLRSPLTSILFLAEAMQRGRSGEVNDLQRRQLGLVYSAALGLSSIASDALEMARGGNELADHGATPLSVIELFESVRDIVRPMAEEKGLEIIIVVPSIQYRLGHPLALSRTILNLTTNALKFTEEGYVEVRATEVDETRVEFSVRDTGPGINPAALDNLYQPFRRRVHREGLCFSWTGLGLAICRKLVEAMGSTLRLETRPAWGTRFSFTLDVPPVRALGAADGPSSAS